MKYVVKRDPVKYTNGNVSPTFYLKRVALGMFAEMTRNIEEAQVFNRKADAKEALSSLGSRWYISKVEQEVSV